MSVYPETTKDETPFLDAFNFWARLGFTVVPGRDDGKAPLVRTMPYFEGLARPTLRDFKVETGRLISDLERSKRPLVLLDSGAAYRLVVVDDDSGVSGDWIQSTFGRTGLVVASGREGGGAHYYYRVPVAVAVHSTASLIRDKIDCKGWHSYVVSPLAVHKTGRRYTVIGIPDWETVIDPAWMEVNVPWFDHDLYKRLVEEGKARRQVARPQTTVTMASGSLHTSTTSGSLDPETVIPGWGLSVVEAARIIGEGNKRPVRCPFHADATPSAVLFSSADRVSIYCSSCSDTWSYTPSVEAPVGDFTLDGPLRVVETPAEDHEDREASRIAAEVADDAAILKEWDEAELDRVLSDLPPPPTPVAPAGPDYLARMPTHATPVPMEGALSFAALQGLAVTPDWAASFRAEWKASGFSSRHEKCGQVRQGLGNTNTGEMMIHTRGCDRMSCIRCGPMRVARKAAGIIYIPITGEKGEIIGSAFRDRPVWLHIIGPESKVGGWRDRYDKMMKQKRLSGTAALEPNVLKNSTSSGQVPLALTIESTGADGYIIFRPPGAQVRVALATIDVGGGERLNPDEFASRVLDLLRWTYRPEPDGLAGFISVDGSISSSRGVNLDPDALVRRAYPSKWIVERKEVLPATTALAQAYGRRLHARATSRDADSGEVETVRIAAPATEAKRQAFWDALTPNPVTEAATAPRARQLSPNEVDMALSE